MDSNHCDVDPSSHTGGFYSTSGILNSVSKVSLDFQPLGSSDELVSNSHSLLCYANPNSDSIDNFSAYSNVPIPFKSPLNKRKRVTEVMSSDEESGYSLKWDELESELESDSSNILNDSDSDNALKKIICNIEKDNANSDDNNNENENNNKNKNISSYHHATHIRTQSLIDVHIPEDPHEIDSNFFHHLIEVDEQERELQKQKIEQDKVKLLALRPFLLRFMDTDNVDSNGSKDDFDSSSLQSINDDISSDHKRRLNPHKFSTDSKDTVKNFNLDLAKFLPDSSPLHCFNSHLSLQNVEKVKSDEDEVDVVDVFNYEVKEEEEIVEIYDDIFPDDEDNNENDSLIGGEHVLKHNHTLSMSKFSPLEHHPIAENKERRHKSLTEKEFDHFLLHPQSFHRDHTHLSVNPNIPHIKLHNPISSSFSHKRSSSLSHHPKSKYEKVHESPKKSEISQLVGFSMLFHIIFYIC
jgi:hypothetical protein